MANVPNVRRPSDALIITRLTDNSVAVDWNSLSEIAAFAYSVPQKQIVCRLAHHIDENDSTKLNVFYTAQQPQYLGLTKLVIRCKYDGREKTYDAPVLNFVPSTAEATGILVIDDPVVNVCLAVEEVSTSLLDDAINAAFGAAEQAEAAIADVQQVVVEFRAHFNDQIRHITNNERGAWNSKLSSATVEGNSLVIR